jgi:ketosteroid isomerase-like protein
MSIILGKSTKTGEMPTMPGQSNPNLAIQERFIAAVFAGERATIEALAAPEFELHEGSGLPFAGVYKGASGFMEFLDTFMATFDIEQLAPVRTYGAADPDFLACEFDLRATVRATGERFESTLVELWSFRDGQVVSIKPHYFNALAQR